MTGRQVVSRKRKPLAEVRPWFDERLKSILEQVPIQEIAQDSPLEAVLIRALLDPEKARPPRTRAGCASLPRPCPRLLCRYHLWMEQHKETKGETYAFLRIDIPGVEKDEDGEWVATDDDGEVKLPESCLLDIADRGETTLEKCGEILGVTREAVRQIEVKSFRLVRAHIETAELDCATAVSNRTGTDYGDDE